MDAAIREAVGTIPPENRRLVTYHDSWAYFALTYGMEVIGAVQPLRLRRAVRPGKWRSS